MIIFTCFEARGLVSDYIDGEVDPQTAAALENHLQTCSSCPPLYASLVDTLAYLKSASAPADRLEELVRRVVAAVDEEKEF